MSYFLWNTMPDAELFSLAEAGGLLDEAVLGAQVERMLADPRARDAVPTFHLQWLGVDKLVGLTKDPGYYPDFTPELALAMRDETATFSDYVIRQGDGLLSTLFTADFSFLQGPLFDLYGVAQPPGFTPGEVVPLDAGVRAGILTQGAFLASHAHPDQTSPVHRGLLVRSNILCQQVDPPPPDVNNAPPPPREATTTRERFEQHEADPVCGGCHRLIDPIGLGFENFDAVGRYRATEDGIEIRIDGSAAAFSRRTSRA
jgi:hypothetical protein